MSTPSKEQIAAEHADEIYCDRKSQEWSIARDIILAAIDKARPRLKNLKMLDDIHRVVMQHSGNQELADSLWCYLRADGGKGAIAPPVAQPQPRGERSEPPKGTTTEFVTEALTSGGSIKHASTASSEPPKEDELD